MPDRESDDRPDRAPVASDRADDLIRSWLPMATQASEFSILLDEDYIVLRANRVQPGMPDAAGRSIFELGILHEANEAIRHAGDEAKRTGLPQHAAVVGPGPNGSVTTYSIWITPLPVDGGSGARFAMVAADVSHLQRVETELVTERGMFQSVVEQAPDTILILDPDGAILFANSPLLGDDPSTMVGTRAEELATPEDRATVRAAIEAVASTGSPTSFTARLVDTDAPRWFECRAGAITRGDEVVRISIVATDITDRVQREATLRESEARFRVLFESAPEAQVIFDVDAGRIVEANPPACELFARPRDELLAMTPIGLSPERQPDGRLSADAIREHTRHVLAGEQLDLEWVFRGQDDAPLPCDVRLVHLPHPGRRLIRGSYRDIRERKRQEAERERLANELAQAQKLQSLGQLTGGIAHDFNNLLVVISGELELIHLDIDDRELVLGHMRAARGAAKRAAALTSRLLAFGRRQPLRPSNIQVNRLIADLEGMLRRTLGEQIAIETVLGGGLWVCEVDPAQLENAVLNLAINARDAMPEGGKLTIETANARLDREYALAHTEVIPGQYVMIAVTDSGVGIDPDVLPAVFEPFFTTKGQGQGSGLGLSMVYGFVKQSGGHVKIYSEPGTGTTVRIYLPRTLAQAAPQPAPRKDEVPRGHGEVVLVVEDDESVRKVAERMLTRIGYEVRTAHDGPSAIAALDSGAIDLLLTDVVLSGPINGAELGRQARAKHPELAVVFMSGYTENAIIHNGRLDADVTLLEKPFSLRQLALTMRDVLTDRD